jgi:ABC-type transport system involved in multi-copper enzyme maturation permease subunit
MWREFFQFDLKYQLRQPLLWVSAAVFGLMAYFATSSDAVQIGGSLGNIYRNAPIVIIRFLSLFTILAMFIITVFIAGAVLRDSEIGISEMIFATPMKKRDYLFGRFLAGFVACLSIFVLISIGIAMGSFGSSLDPARFGPFSIDSYLYAFAVMVVPNLLFISALLMLLAATTRSILQVYVGVVVLLTLSGVAGQFAKHLDHDWAAALMDPFGLSALGQMVKYDTIVEANTRLPSLSSFLLVNRVLWLGITALLFGATVQFFKPTRAGTGRSWFSRGAKPLVVEQRQDTVLVRPTVPTFTTGTALLQCLRILWFDTWSILRSAPFLVMLLLALSNLLASVIIGQDNDARAYPVTRLMLRDIAGAYNFMLAIIVAFYGGELVFKERQAKISDVMDALPVPNWAPLLAHCMSLVAVVLCFMSAGILTTMGFQLVRGGVDLQPLLYIKGELIEAMPFILLGLLGIAFQVLSNSKFIGYLAVVLVIILPLAFTPMHLDFNLYRPLDLPTVVYSDLNGYGHFLRGWGWLIAYWSFFVLAALCLSSVFWIRGLVQPLPDRVRRAGRGLRGPMGLALVLSLAAFVGSGVWIYYNTTVLNVYRPSSKMNDLRADYEKTYRKYIDLPQPRITAVTTTVDIYPSERRVVIHGHYDLVNRQSAPIDTLFVQTNALDREKQNSAHFPVVLSGLPGHTIAVDDNNLGVQILKLDKPLEPGDTMPFDFTVMVTHSGFTNDDAPDEYNLNGTFFNNMDTFPQFGYDHQSQLTDRNERRKRGLGEPERFKKLEDVAARGNNELGQDADWITLDATLSTSDDQIALSPGYLVADWEKDGRHYYHYKLDQPILNYFSFQSSSWQQTKADWRGVPITVYSSPQHLFNVQHMILAVQKSLDYYTANFSPYQFKQLRILEFPRYATFAQSFANTIPFSEEIGFITDLRDPEQIDYVYYVTAHEVAHQWWGHQVVSADVQGASMLIESLAQYSALMVMEQQLGRDHMHRFLRRELDGYLRGRGGERVEEEPLARVEEQQYIHYNKGALVFYRLRDEIGEDAVNRALRNFIKAYAFKGPPYPTSLDLLALIRAETPPDKQGIVTDLFEKIVFYDNRVIEASARPRSDGQWDVTMKVHLAKLDVDGRGNETPRAYDEPVEIGVFSRPDGGKEADEKVLFLAKQKLDGAEPTLHFTVAAKPYDVGVDPYNKLIDRVPADNRMKVSIEK